MCFNFNYSMTSDAAIAKSVDKFSNSFYEQLLKSNEHVNLICSPLSVQICASMLRMGAIDGSATAKQLDNGLKLSSRLLVEIANNFNDLVAYYEQYSVLQMASKLYLHQDYELSKSFQDLLASKYRSPAELIDFENAEAAASSINSWVQQKTNNCIKQLISAAALGADTTLLLVNAIHFKANWRIQFDKLETSKEYFQLDAAGNKRLVKMMHATNYFEYALLKSLKAKALRLRYTNCALSMLIILPDQAAGLHNLQRKLASTSLENITKQLRKLRIDVKLPKFKAEFEQELSPIFQQLHMQRLFNAPEFKLMIEQQTRIDVSKIIHKAYIEVNEQGSEAAAATAAVLMTRSLPQAPSPPPEPEIFHADRPFYFTIYDDKYGRLFVGNLKLPAEASNLPACECGQDVCECEN
ncbi:serine protease inhibitor 42Dd-like [Drosophila busckii]|uniref:serine protease inhibitor 42Dd-like n=1 Tax=Drosophila busckii TaxID=30019 RepID=UPI00083F4E47|nr:serine protease inhibitor 42Dd-like [Drosophila busckii]